MKSGRPLLLLTAYYLFVGLVAVGLGYTFPILSQYLPFGGIDTLQSGMSEFMTGQVTPIQWEPVEKSIRLVIALVAVLVLMEPVAWIYMGARRRRGREQSFVLTILLLPVVVAGIVIIVQNSLALAFSLAGIVAGVRFRLTLDDSLDAIYIFVAIGAGLAAGIEALELTIVITVMFNYLVLLFWEFDSGEEVSVDRWFTREWMSQDPADDGPKRPVLMSRNDDDP